MLLVQIREDFIVDVFVHHQKVNQKGEIVEKHDNEEESKYGDSLGESDESEEENGVADAEKDDEEDQQITNKF